MSWRGGHRFASPDFGPAVRGLLLMFVAIWVALVWGPDNAALPVGTAMAIVGSVLTQRDVPGRRPAAAVMILAFAVAAAVGILDAGIPPLFIGVAVVVCLGTGLTWLLGGGVGLTGMSVVVVLLTAGAVPATLSATVTTVGLVLGFGAVHLVIAVRRTTPEESVARHAVAVRYGALAGYASALSECRVLDLSVSDPVPSDEMPSCIATTLQSLCAGPTRGCCDSRCDETLRAAAEVLGALAEESTQAPAHAVDALHRLDDIRVPAPPTALCRLRTELHQAVVGRFGLDEPLSTTSPRVATAQIRSQLRWSSPLVRHAVRLALGVGIALAVALYQHLPEGVWMALAVLLVLRPGCPQLYTRCAERIAGMAVGLTVATAITMLWHPGPPVTAILVVAFLAAGWAVHVRGPWGISLELAAAIAIVMDPGATDGLFGHRLLAAALGAAIAVGMYVLVPDPHEAKVCRAVTNVLRAQLAYAAVDIRAFVNPGAVAPEERRAAFHEALTARRIIEASAEAARQNTPEAADVLAAASHEAGELAINIAVLDHHLPSHRQSPSAALRPAGEEYVTALRGAGMPWHLDAGWLRSADEALRLEGAPLASDEGVAVLLTQIEAITRHALALGDMAERVTGHLSYAYAMGDNVH